MALGFVIFGGGPSTRSRPSSRTPPSSSTATRSSSAASPSARSRASTSAPTARRSSSSRWTPTTRRCRQGTTAQIRETSLSSVAGRQIQLDLPPSNSTAPDIPNGGEIPLADTISEVDIDQIFNTLSPKTINDFKHVIQGFDISYEGSAKQANQGFKYFNPLLSTSRRVFGELTRDTPDVLAASRRHLVALGRAVRAGTRHHRC